MANKSGIKIKKANKGKFTKKAKAAGMSVQEFAKHVKAHPENYSGTTRQEANFARNAKTKFKHQTGGQTPDNNPYADYMNEQLYGNVDIPNRPDNVLPVANVNTTLANVLQQPNEEQLSNPGVFRPTINSKKQKGKGPKQDNPYVGIANSAMSLATGVKNALNESQLRHQEKMQMLEGMTPRFMPNMEQEGLNNVPAFTMYGGNLDRATYYGSMHGEGDDTGRASFTSGPNFRQYSRGIESDTATGRTEADVPVADKPGKMPRRYAAGGPVDDYVMFMAYGGADFGVPKDYSDMDNEDFGFSGIAHNGPYGNYSIYRAGGNVSQNKAKEILRDGTVHGQPLTEKQKRYFGWLAGGAKAQTGGTPSPQQQTPPPQQQQQAPQQQPQMSQEDYYRASATLAYYKDKLNAQLKQKNPQAFGDYFKGLVDKRRSGNVQSANDYVQSSQYNEYLSPDEVKKTLGTDKDYQNYLNSLKQVNTYNVNQGKQPLYGTEEGQTNDPSQLNYGRRFASLQVTPSFSNTIKNENTGTNRTYNRMYNYNPQTGNVDFTETGDLSIRPQGFALPPQQQQQQPPQQQTTVASRQYGGRKYQVGGHTYPTTRMQAGGAFSVGDEVDLSEDQIEELRRQGYKIEQA